MHVDVSRRDVAVDERCGESNDRRARGVVEFSPGKTPLEEKNLEESVRPSSDPSEAGARRWPLGIRRALFAETFSRQNVLECKRRRTPPREEGREGGGGGGRRNPRP